jgi:hemoglobin-like flavoprotein
MKPRQINLIRSTWKLAAANAGEVGPMFYETLFEIAPEPNPLFNPPVQSKKLLTMLWYIISKLNSRCDITEEVTKLAQCHVKNDAQEKHYSYVGAALLKTLEKSLGDAWNKEVKEAWAACFDILSSAMMNGPGCTERDVA